MHRQGPILLLTLVGWALMPALALWSLVLAYGIAWLIVDVVAIARPTLLEISKERGILLSIVVAAVPLASISARWDALLENEGLSGSEENAADRARLEAVPSFFPPVVFADHPQTIYVHAPSADSAGLRVGDVEPAPGTSLGHGLFRVVYDPRRHGAPRSDGPTEIDIVADGRAHRRTAHAVVPRPHPRWFCGSADRRLAATVSEETDELVVVSRSGLVTRIDVGDAPSDCSFIDDRRVAVSHRHQDTLLVIDVPAETTLGRIPLTAGQARVVYAPASKTLAVAVNGPEPGIFLVDAEAASVVDFLPTDADWLAFARDGEALIVTSQKRAVVERFDLGGALPRRRALHLGRPAVTLAVSPDGTRAMIAVTDYRADGSVHYGNHFVQDQLLEIDVEAFAVVDRELTARRSSRQANAGDVDRGGSPMGIELGEGRWARVAFAGTSEVWTLGLAPRPEIVDVRELLPAPHSTFTFEDGSFAVTSPSDGSIGLFDEAGKIMDVIRLAPDDRALLAESEHALARRMGARTFYETTRSGIACQSCHLHAHTDHVMRNIGERRLSPTLTVRGVAGTAPYLRDGSYPRIADLEHLSRTLFRGFVTRAPGRGHTLEAFVESLPRTPSLGLHAERDLARERRGLDVFVRAGCPTCHAPPAFTNLGQHPLGALFPERAAELGADAILDVPTLIGVSERGPLLTDGRAESLEALLRDHNDAGRHGRTDDLDDDEIADLVHFLEML